MLSTPEAYAYGTNGLILKSDADNRYKMFVNGEPTIKERDNDLHIYNHLFSLTGKTKNKILNLTKNIMDIIEVPYTSLHRSYGSVHCTIEEFFIKGYKSYFPKIILNSRGRRHL